MLRPIYTNVKHGPTYYLICFFLIYILLKYSSIYNEVPTHLVFVYLLISNTNCKKETRLNIWYLCRYIKIIYLIIYLLFQYSLLETEFIIYFIVYFKLNWIHLVHSKSWWFCVICNNNMMITTDNLKSYFYDFLRLNLSLFLYNMFNVKYYKKHLKLNTFNIFTYLYRFSMSKSTYRIYVQ